MKTRRDAPALPGEIVRERKQGITNVQTDIKPFARLGAATLTEFCSCRIIRGVASAAAGSKAVTETKTRIQWHNKGLAREQGLYAPAAGGAAHE